MRLIKKILKNMKFKIHNLKLLKKLKPNRKIKRVLKIAYLVKKLGCIVLLTKNLYGIFRKMYSILLYRNKIWLLPNLVLKTVFLVIVFIKQVKGVFKILIFFLPTLKTMATRILLIQDKYKKYLIGSINPIIRNSMYFSRVYASPYFNKGFMYTVVLILSTGIFLPQKAAALTPNEIDRMVNIFCEFYNRVTKDAEQLTTKQFGFCYGVDYTTQMISKHVALSLTYGRKCLSVYNSLPGHQKLVYMAVEAGMHTYAVTSQINLSCAALDIDPTSKRRLTSELFSLAIQKILNETNSESAKSNSGTFGSGKPN